MATPKTVMDTAHLKEIESNDEVRKNLAKWLVHDCFRNRELESLHDRISEEEMKTATKDAVT
jgi:hypothetical protein